MAYLARAKKVDLITLVREFNLEPLEGATKVQLVDQILGQKNYNEEMTKNYLAGLVNEREEMEHKETELREYELKKLELESASKNKKENVTPSSTVKSPDILKLISKYNSHEEISIYLTLFERQIKRLNIDKQEWVTYLLGLLPLEIVNIIGRENEEVANDYDHVKQVLLKRFKLSPEQFRQKFFAHKKENLASWKDYSFELGTFLDEWLSGLKVLTYEDLKNILIIDQIRRKLPFEMKEHFLDEMPNFTKVSDFTEKLDNYETARSNVRRNFDAKNPNNEIKMRFAQNESRNNYRSSVDYQGSKYEKNPINMTRNNSTPFKIKCFYCNEYASHKSNQCPRRKDGSVSFNYRQSGHKSDQRTFNSTKNVNTTTNRSCPSEKIIKAIEIRGKIVNTLIDSGSDLTIINESLYKALGCPGLSKNDVKLSGISGNELSPTGYFTTEILIDNISISCDIYVLENLRYEMILGNNCLSKLNFEISEIGLKVTGKRNYKVNIITAVPSKIPDSNAESSQVNIPTALPNLRLNSSSTRETNSNLRLSSQNIPTIELPESCIPKFESVYLAETVDSICVNEIDLAHVTDSRIKKELINLIKSYKPQKTKSVDMKVEIILKDDIPVTQRPRRLAFAEQAFVDKQIQEWLNEGIIRESCSNYAAPIVLAKKKNGNLRLCVDFRKLNKKIIRDNYPLPLMDEVLDNIGQNKVFSTLDLKNGFFHVGIKEESKKYTSFVTNNSQYEFNRLAFGLSLSPQKFQKYMCACLRDLIRDKTIQVYMDDIIVLAQSEEEALIKLKRVFQVASEYGLEFNFSKCQFLKRRIEFLGYIIENGTIRPSEAQTLAVEKFPEPRNKKQLQSFLGLTGYFRRYIADYAKIAKPLSDILRNENEFEFGQIQKEAFKMLKIKLSNKPVLHIFRQGADTELHTDASSLGFGAVLLQKDDFGNLHPIHFMSRKTTPVQAKYSSYELEALAVIESLKKFRNYLIGNKFKIITDCSAFQKTLEKKDLQPKVARWAMYLQEFDYEIIHRPGNRMKHVDALSRNAVLVLTRSFDEITTKLVKAQNEDDYIQTIKTLIEKNESSNYFIKHNLVYKYENGNELIMVPENMQKEIIRNIHNKGHYALSKTEAVVKQDFYIPNIKTQIENVISNCVECILCNKKKGKGEGLLNPIPKHDLPLQTYHVDHLGPMPSTNKNYNYIFTVVDAFTKFAWFYPVKTTSAKEAISKLRLQQATFGNPARIISDRGAAFTSTDFKNYLEEENIEHVLITTGIPRGNGQVERIQGMLIPILTKLSIDDHTKWYKYVPAVQRIMNSTCSRSTNFTPFELLTGVKIKDKTDLRIKQILDEEHENSFFKERHNNREIAKQNILKVQEENRKYFNRKRKKARCYQIGELVAIYKTQFGVGAKLRPKYYGPYKIIKVKCNDRYDVEKVGSHEGPVVTSTAADHMKPWVSLN